MTNNFLIKILLLPIYVLFAMIVWVKNKLYDYQLLSSQLPDIYTISVGNLAVGGTGKTPFVEYLVNIFGEAWPTAILSRGYGRKTKGFIRADENSDASIVGDEPFQYFLKFGDLVKVFVGENRVKAVNKIIELEPNINLLLLDDAFQHRQIIAHHSIILSDYNNLIYNDLMLPIGKLREPITSLKRADTIIITKCLEDLSIEESGLIKRKLEPFCREETKIFFTKICYEKPIQFNGNAIEMSNQIQIISGLANSKPFVNYCNEHWTVLQHFDYPDHYCYQEDDISKISKGLSQNVSILVTEKDFVKLKDKLPKEVAAFYLPIKVDFLFGENEQFIKQIKGAVKAYYES
ncbi:MAG: tetraacyldisaccharide 4'-kinase [Bacteroidota bacterium]